MNNHWKIPRKIENQSENDIIIKVGLHTLNGGAIQPDNRETNLPALIYNVMGHVKRNHFTMNFILKKNNSYEIKIFTDNHSLDFNLWLQR